MVWEQYIVQCIVAAKQLCRLIILGSLYSLCEEKGLIRK